MRKLPEVGLNFEAERAAVAVYSTTDELRRGMRQGIGKTVHGWHPSLKVGTTQFMGKAQASAMRVFDLQTDVATYRTWPVEVRFSEDARAHSWVPDIGVRFRNGRRAVLDLLSRDEAALFRQHRLHPLLTRALWERGIAYVAREQAAFSRSRPCLNAAYALRFRNAVIDEALALRIEGLVIASQRRTLSDLVALLSPMPGVLGTTCAMAWAGRLSLGLAADEPLSMTVRAAGASR